MDKVDWVVFTLAIVTGIVVALFGFRRVGIEVAIERICREAEYHGAKVEGKTPYCIYEEEEDGTRHLIPLMNLVEVSSVWANQEGW